MQLNSILVLKANYSFLSTPQIINTSWWLWWHHYDITGVNVSDFSTPLSLPDTERLLRYIMSTKIRINILKWIQPVCVCVRVCVCTVHRCVTSGVCFPLTTITSSTITSHLLLCLAEWRTSRLSTWLTCLHSSGLQPALWLPPIDLFQETLEARRPEIKKVCEGVQKKGVILPGSLWEAVYLFFCCSHLNLKCVETLTKTEFSVNVIIYHHGET